MLLLPQRESSVLQPSCVLPRSAQRECPARRRVASVAFPDVPSCWSGDSVGGDVPPLSPTRAASTPDTGAVTPSMEWIKGHVGNCLDTVLWDEYGVPKPVVAIVKGYAFGTVIIAYPVCLWGPPQHIVLDPYRATFGPPYAYTRRARKAVPSYQTDYDPSFLFAGCADTPGAAAALLERLYPAISADHLCLRSHETATVRQATGSPPPSTVEGERNQPPETTTLDTSTDNGLPAVEVAARPGVSACDRIGRQRPTGLKWWPNPTPVQFPNAFVSSPFMYVRQMGSLLAPDHRCAVLNMDRGLRPLNLFRLDECRWLTVERTPHTRSAGVAPTGHVRWTALDDPSGSVDFLLFDAWYVNVAGPLTQHRAPYCFGPFSAAAHPLWPTISLFDGACMHCAQPARLVGCPAAETSTRGSPPTSGADPISLALAPRSSAYGLTWNCPKHCPSRPKQPLLAPPAPAAPSG